jgi:UDP:flavonoid glycosyltransferase YjiC (YdhE family)
MKFVVAGYGSRGDVEPCVAVGRELLRCGHDVHWSPTCAPSSARDTSLKHVKSPPT